MFTIEQLKEYSVGFREKVALYESQILKSEQDKQELQSTPIPDENEVRAFAKEASKAVQGLDFKAKKGVIRNVVKRVVGTNDRLQVYGFIPVTTENNVNVFTNDRDGVNTPRHAFNEETPKLVPFQIQIDISLLSAHNLNN